MKRILVLLSVVALMVVMVAMSVAPAFANRPQYLCTLGTNFSVVVYKQEAKQLQEDFGFTCVRLENRR